MEKLYLNYTSIYIYAAFAEKYTLLVESIIFVKSDIDICLSFRDLTTFLLLCFQLQESVEIQVSKNDDQVDRVEQESIEGHHISERDGEPLIRLIAGLINQEVRSVTSGFPTDPKEEGSEVETGEELAYDQAVVKITVGFQGRGNRFNALTAFQKQNPKKITNIFYLFFFPDWIQEILSTFIFKPLILFATDLSEVVQAEHIMLEV